MTARLCSAVGCYLTAGPRGRCVTHARELAARRDPRTTTEAGYGWEHQKLRARVLREAGADPHGLGGTCHLCGGPGTLADRLEVDHIQPLSMGGGGGISNLAGAHRSCNARKGGANRLRRTVRWSR